MKVAFGLYAHSGWAALIALGRRGSDFEVVDRRRIELVEESDADWARQPYHAAEALSPEEARDVVRRGIESARRLAVREMRAAVKRARDQEHQVTACGMIVGGPMPVWTVAEILAVHFRMHKAEGFLFRDALVRAAKACKLRVAAVPEKLLAQHAERSTGIPVTRTLRTIASLGKSVGPPWGKDQKAAALVASIALQESTR